MTGRADFDLGGALAQHPMGKLIKKFLKPGADGTHGYCAACGERAKELKGPCPKCGKGLRETSNLEHPAYKMADGIQGLDLSGLTRQELLDLHAQAMREMDRRGMPATRIHNKLIKLRGMAALVRLFQSAKDYLVKQPTGTTQPFVYQLHVRGIPPEMTIAQAQALIQGNGPAGESVNIHGDLRMQLPGKNDLVGLTLFTPGNPDQRDKVLDWKPGDITRGVLKDVHPVKPWLTANGRVEPGETGATENTAGLFIVKGTGRMTYGTQKPGFHEFFLKFSQPKLQRLNGRWIFTRVEDRWLFSKPQDQVPYSDRNPDERSAQAVLQYVPVPGLDIPRETDS